MGVQSGGSCGESVSHALKLKPFSEKFMDIQ